ncbi:S66 peptidase family protein [Flagellimonas sp. S174]|uniref:S66 peptidase family protein n=1 Tax=Flagellimonas sp. S174 TaxID=3410790 RepID=UPI003BF5BA62
MKVHTCRIVVFCLVLFISISAFGQNDNQIYIQPPFLTSGDTVAIVAPAGILKNREKSISKAMEILSSWGLHPILGKHLYAKNNHFAGTDAQRAEDFQNAMDDPSVKAIWCARGGYGSMRILDKLDFSNFEKSPKWIVGFSDITAFHGKLDQLGIQSIHGMMAAGLELSEELSDETQENINSLKKALFGEVLRYELDSSPHNKKGMAKGVLIGGNLSLLQASLQSDANLDTEGKILFIEEIGEYRYSIDRMLYSLKRAGYFDGLAALVVGEISKVRTNTTPFGMSNEELILDVVKECDFPVLFHFPAGHGDENRTMIFGEEVTLDVGVNKSVVTFEKQN